MKFQPHKTITVGDNKLIVSEGEIKEGNYFLFQTNEPTEHWHDNTIHNAVRINSESGEVFDERGDQKEYSACQLSEGKLVIAQLPSSSPLVGIPLCEEIGVEELAEILYPDRTTAGYKDHWNKSAQEYFIIGYNLNKSDGVYNESDMRKAFSEGIAIGQDEEPITESESTVYLLGSHQEYDSDFNRLIKSLPQTIQLLCNDDGELIMINNSFKYKSPTN